MTSITSPRNFLMALAIVPAMIACGDTGDSITPPLVNGADLFFSLRANHQAVTMQVGEQLQLQAQGLNPLGEPIPSIAPTVTFRSTDTTRIKITEGGLMTAAATGTNVMVIATGHDDRQNVTNADTIRVTITQNKPTIASFSIQPDSTLTAAGAARSLPALILASNGDTIRNVAIKYGTSDFKKLDVNPQTGALTARDVGTVKIWATATLYGTVWSDTVEMTVTYPISASITVSNLTYLNLSTPLYFSATDLTVRKGAVVRFTTRTTVPIDIVFNNPAGVVGGNVSLPGTVNAFQERTFNTIGTFTYSSPQFSGTGKITVVP
jgi:plastocyanin